MEDLDDFKDTINVKFEISQFADFIVNEKNKGLKEEDIKILKEWGRDLLRI